MTDESGTLSYTEMDRNALIARILELEESESGLSGEILVEARNREFLQMRLADTADALAEAEHAITRLQAERRRLIGGLLSVAAAAGKISDDAERLVCEADAAERLPREPATAGKRTRRGKTTEGARS